MPRLSIFRPAPTVLNTVFAAALACIVGIQPAAAQSGTGAPYAHNHWQGPGPDAPPVPALPSAAAPAAQDPDPAAGRREWLAECRRRLSARDEWKREWERERGGRHRRSQDAGGPDQCESYLDDYLAHAQAGYAQHMRTYSGQSPYMVSGRAMGANGSGCCCEREVIETIEEVLPARRVVPRRAPPRDKRIRIAPDKRVRTQ